MSLARANGDIVDKDTIKTECWGEMKVTDNALHRKLHALRQLLRSVSNNVTVETKYGAGIFLGYKEKTESTHTTQTFDQAS
jgi:DNA-binding winged helix-turn-helix (wHTH) protein